MKSLQEKNRRNAMDYSSLILMERDNETGFVSKEVGSFQVSEGAEFVKNFYVKGDTVYFIFDTKEDVEEYLDDKDLQQAKQDKWALIEYKSLNGVEFEF